MKKKIAVFISDYTIWNSPSLINLLNLLNKNYQLTAFIGNTFNKNIDFLIQNRFQFFIFDQIKFSLNIKYFFYMMRYFRNRFNYLFCYKDFDLNICIDVKGFCQYLDFGNQNTSLLYYSLELQLLNDKDPDQLLKHLIDFQLKEREYISRIKGVLIQSIERKNYFFHNYKLKESIPYFLLPVTNDGSISKVKSDYLQKKYKQINDKKIILYIGGIHPYYKVKELVESIGLSNEYILFLHGYNEFDYVKSIKNEVIQKGFRNIIFSEEVFLNIEETDKIYQSADIGLVWYEYDSLNFKTAAASSGKICGYLRYGLPIIVNKECGGDDIVENPGCGVAISQPADISLAIKKILNNYETMRENCFTNFEKRYKFENYKDTLIEFIEQL